MHFSFEKHVPSQVFKGFSVENLETTPSNFISKFFFWDIIPNVRSVQFGLCCIRIFFFFFSFLSLLVFSLTATNDSQDSRDGRGNHSFSCFPLPPAHEHSFSSSRFLPLLFNQSICNYQTDSWWDFFSLEICILFPISLMQLSRSWHFKVTLWGFELILNYQPSITKRTP